MAKAEININKLTNNHTMTVKVDVTKQFKARIVVATTLIKAAAWILGCNIEIESSESH
ncbi:MAG: hypothetical protein ACE5IR_09575 [bacterium]